MKTQYDYDESDIMDFSAALTITLPKNEYIQKMTVYLDNTGEPAQGFVGDELVKHCSMWTTIKKGDEIMKKLQGLMYFKIIICSATQITSKSKQEWKKYQNSSEYLYGFAEKKINLGKCPTRGEIFVDKEIWKKYKLKEEEIKESINKNSKIQKTAIKSTVSSKITSIKTKNNIPVRQQYDEPKLTKSQIEYVQHKTIKEQNKLNQSMKQKGQKQWSWRKNVDLKAEKFKKEQEEKLKKERETKSKQGFGGGGVQKKYAFFEADEEEKNNDSIPAPIEAPTSPPGSDNVKCYFVNQIVHVWSESKKQWVDGEVMESISLWNIVKIKYDGKIKPFRLPNVNQVRLKE